MSDLLLIEDFLDAATCEAMLEELRTAESTAATTYGRQDRGREVNVAARRTTSLMPSPALRSRIIDRLRVALDSIAQHFGVAVSEIEEPQFLRYAPGDFFVAHQDGNTSLLRADATNIRLLSTVIFLSEPSAYEGGSLVIHHTFEDRQPVTPRAGTLVAFRAETTHEVTVLTRGERFTIVSWYR